MLRMSEREREDVKKQLKTELRIKQEKQHSHQQKVRSEQKLEEAKKANMDKLMEQLEDKDLKLRVLSDEQTKHQKMKEMSREKSHQQVVTVKRQLQRERVLKMDAYQRVDELQTQIYDISTGVFVSRPHTAATSVRTKSSRNSSAKKVMSSHGTSSGNLPYGIMGQQRSLTPATDIYTRGPVSSEYQRAPRPKTTIGRLRTRVLDQLLNDLEPPDHHETIREMEETRQQQQLQQLEELHQQQLQQQQELRQLTMQQAFISQNV